MERRYTLAQLSQIKNGISLLGEMGRVLRFRDAIKLLIFEVLKVTNIIIFFIYLFVSQMNKLFIIKK